ncbi:beta-hydroxyacyl-ACP dehydratase [Acidipropionibacterium jensenii]|uniref:3-hydroxyacyl-ACP dehydratase FabZ family protein n=1 Tax=Acidipropionibacterium jensenii TaxID=1749 RepID=UPI000BC2F965|nr:beta-hydroxyacyl-ACP dehydratase [Acidipropionibacterium jensenii]AZZ42946.1 beta-hydroxyacyl-ACP dehydratase [Acidipropionibacterium jensenii]
MTPASPLCYSADQIHRMLPHGYPFVLLDGVEDVVPGVSGTGIKNITISDPVFNGHFPGRAIYPGVLLIEISGHTCGIVQQADQTPEEGSPEAAGGAPRRIGVLAGVRRFSFHHVITPGDVVRFRVRRRAVLAEMFEYAVRVEVGSRLAAEGTVAIAMQAEAPI